MNRNTQLLVLSCVIVAGVLLSRIVLQEGEKTPNIVVPEDSAPVQRTLAISVPPPGIEQALEQNNNEPLELWAASSDSIDMDIPAAQSDIEGAVLLEYDTNRLRSLQYGDSLQITVPQMNTAYRVQVEKVTNHPGGIKVIQARQSDNVRLLLTLGQKNTFANLATLDGNFELVGNTSAGWLMPAENMDPDLDPSIPDYVVLPQARMQAKRQILN